MEESAVRGWPHLAALVSQLRLDPNTISKRHLHFCFNFFSQYQSNISTIAIRRQKDAIIRKKSLFICCQEWYLLLFDSMILGVSICG